MKLQTPIQLTLTSILAIGLVACGGDEGDDGNNNNNNTDIPQTVLRSAGLTNIDGTPSATGTVTIREDAAGKRFVYLGTDFVQGMGPGDTELRLAAGSNNVADQQAADGASVSPAIGIIPNGATGDFLFEIPAGVDHENFNFVIVWCPTAGVNFGVGTFGDAGNRSWTASLVDVDGTPSATGMVTITETGVGQFKIDLGADFAQAMGPGDTEIRLARDMTNAGDQIAADATSVSDSVGIVANGSSGAMSFDFTGAEPSDFGYVIIWCPTAGVNFGVGGLSAVSN
ncbi:MAG: DM13 domain-containing protein [Deltaproteobacteria bacterium]|jgi:hypothetical protein